MQKDIVRRSKKIRKSRLYRKSKLSNKKYNGGAPKLERRPITHIHYNGPNITPELFRRFLQEFRMGYDVTANISKQLSDPYLVCKSNADISAIEHNSKLNLSQLDDSIMISCDITIPHYYLFKPHVVELIRRVILQGSSVHSVNLFINNAGFPSGEVITL